MFFEYSISFFFVAYGFVVFLVELAPSDRPSSNIPSHLKKKPSKKESQETIQQSLRPPGREQLKTSYPGPAN